MALFSDIVMDHFMHPRNVGEIPDADGVGQVGNAKCGDIMKMYLKIKDNVIQDVKFETFGCGSAIASSSMATEMVKGKPLTEETVETFAHTILDDINPRDSWRASKAFRQHIAVEIAKRCLVKSIELAGGELA